MNNVIAVVISVLLLCPSFGEGGQTMATARYNSATGNTEWYNDKGGVVKIDVGKNTAQNSNPTYTTQSGSGAILDPTKDATGMTFTNENGKRRRWDAKSGTETDAYLDELFKAKLKAQLAALGKQRDSALSTLDNQKTSLANDFYGKKNQVAANSDVGAMNFAQFMASRGVAGNAGAMPEIYRNNALQGQLGALNQQEAEGNAAIEANRANINTAYDADAAAAKNANEAERLAAILEQQAADEAVAREQAQIDAANTATADKMAYSQFQDTKADYAANVGQYYNDFQAQINKVLGDDDPSNDWQADILGAARAKKIKEMEDAKAKASQQQFDNDYKTKQLELSTKRTDYTINRPYSGGGNGLSVSQQNLNAKNTAQQLAGDIQTYLDQWASGKASDQSGRADQNDMINYLKANSGALTAQGVDVNALLEWVKNNYTWVR